VREAGAALDDLAGRMDAVLIDAPCTGTGVWRRRPDAKWKLTDQALALRLGEQAALLADAARYVKPGGRLAYVTCSLLPDENADQVAAFLQQNQAFNAVPPAEAASVVAGLRAAALDVGNGLVLSPRLTGTDGFFISVMRRA
jgi:16S rRNA (cytosine967-C5)-methyltransferase